LTRLSLYYARFSKSGVQIHHQQRGAVDRRGDRQRDPQVIYLSQRPGGFPLIGNQLAGWILNMQKIVLMVPDDPSINGDYRDDHGHRDQNNH